MRKIILVADVSYATSHGAGIISLVGSFSRTTKRLLSAVAVVAVVVGVKKNLIVLGSSLQPTTG